MTSEHNFDSKLRNRDFTINTFNYDGETLRSAGTANTDIQSKTLRAVEPFGEHIKESPQSMLRAFRFASVLGFNFNERLVDHMTIHKKSINDNSQTRMTEELYEIIRGPYVLNAIYHMTKTGYLKNNQVLNKIKDDKIDIIGKSIQARLVYLDHLIKNGTIKEMINTFGLSDSFSDYVDDFSYVFDIDIIHKDSRNFPFIINLKRYQYGDNKKQMLDFLKKSNE